MKLLELLLEYLDREKTLKNYGEKLEQRSKTDHSARGLDQNQLLDKFIESDPTGNKGTYVLWMINAYLKKGINYIEDLDRTKYALELYHKFKHKLPQEQQDINGIKSLNDLEDIVEQFREQKTGKEVKKEIKQEILNETEVLYNRPEGMVISPKTERASIIKNKLYNDKNVIERIKFFLEYLKDIRFLKNVSDLSKKLREVIKKYRFKK